MNITRFYFNYEQTDYNYKEIYFVPCIFCKKHFHRLQKWKTLWNNLIRKFKPFEHRAFVFEFILYNITVTIKHNTQDKYGFQYR